MSYLLLSACGPAALIFDKKYLQNYFQKDVHKYLQNAHFQKDVLKYVHNYLIKYFQRYVLPGAVCMWTSSTCVFCPAVRACVLLPASTTGLNFQHIRVLELLGTSTTGLNISHFTIPNFLCSILELQLELVLIFHNLKS